MASAILFYNMLVPILQKDTIDQIDKSLKNFWRREYDEKSKKHTIRWNEICKPINEGGLGIRDIENKDLALLGKTYWRYLHNDDLLCSKILKVRYCLKKLLLDAKWKNGNSWFWKDFNEVLKFIKK